MEKQRISVDSPVHQFNTFYDSVEAKRQIQSNNQNLDGLVSMMRERERKERQAMWMRIGFGIVLLIVGIIGIMRKKRSRPRE